MNFWFITLIFFLNLLNILQPQQFNNTSPPLYRTDSIPADLKDPFYTDQYEQEHLKPPVASLLLSADLYCRAGSLILKSDAAKPLLGHDAVIQALAQRGLYVTDQERLVTERDLRKRPLQMVRDTYTEEMRPTEEILGFSFLIPTLLPANF